MKGKPIKIIVATVAILAAAGLAILVVGKIHASPPDDPADAQPYTLSGNTIVADDDAAAKAAGISETTIVPHDVPVTLTLTGRTGLNMETVSHVRAQFGGKVIGVGPELGAQVNGPPSTQPTVLCVIESNDLAQAKAAWIQAKIQLKLDADTLDRTKELVAAKVLAEKFLIDAQSAVTKDAAALEATRQQLMIFGLTQKEIDDVDKQVGRQRMDYVITSPRTGVVAEKGVAGGEIADPTLNLFTIADTKTLWVWGDVYERKMSDRVKVGQPIKIYFTSEPGRARDCRIDWISPVLDPNTHSVKIRGVLDNQDGHFLSDMYCTMVITVGDGKASLIVPAEAVVRQDTSACLFVQIAAQNGKKSYRRTPVKTEPIDIGFGSSDIASAVAGAVAPGTATPASACVRVIEGLKPGDTIVTAGALGLSNAMDDMAKSQ